jgi:predicted amidohydrolase
MSKVQVGLVQMSCTANKEENLQKAIAKTREAAAKGAQIVCLQELFTSLYFCDEENYDNFLLAEAIPGPSTDALSAVAKELGVVIIASLFEKRTQGLYHNTTAVLTLANTAKCISLMIRLIMKNFTLLPAISVTKYSKQNSPALVYSSAGISGILKQHGLPH